MAIDAHVVIRKEGSNSLRSFEETGMEQYKAFVQKRLSCGEVPFYAPIKKNSSQVFNSKEAKIQWSKGHHLSAGSQRRNV